MGAAAYNRGSRAISRQIDVEARPLPSVPLNWDLERSELLKRIATLETDKVRAVACIRRMELGRKVEREGRTEERDRLLRRVHSAEHFGFLRDRQWRWVSGMVRIFLTPQQVDLYREMQ